MRRRIALGRLLVTSALAGALVTGAAVLASPSGEELSGVVAVSTAGKVRSLGVPTFPAKRASAPVVDIALSPSGLGYVTIDRDGATYTYGDAVHPGVAKPPKQGVTAVAVEPTPSGTGALVVFTDGSVRALGDAVNVSSGAADRTPVVDAAMTPTGAGLWLLHRSGAVRALGDAPSIGRAPASGSPTTGIAPTPTGQGMWIAREDGSVVALGDAVGERGPRPADAAKVTGIASLGVLDDWVVVDVEGNVERRGESPQPLPGTGAGLVALDTTASSAAVTSAGPDAPWTKIVSPGVVLDVAGNPAESLEVALPCFVTSGPAAIEEGDVIATAIGPETPNGLLQRVTALGECASGRILATTEPATLSDALPSGELDFSDDLSDLQLPDFTPTSQDGSVTPVLSSPSPFVAPTTSTSGVKARQAGAAGATAGAVGTVADPGRFQYGCPSDPEDGDPSLKAKPIFSFNPDVIFEGEWDGDEAHIRTGISLQGEIGVEFSANKGLSCDATFALIDDYSLGTKVIFVGPIPVVLEPQLTLEAKLEGTVGGTLTASASATGTATGALVVDVDSTPTFSTPGSLTAQGHLEYEFEAKAELSFSLTPSIGFLLYGIVAPTAELESGLAATFEACESPNFKLEEPAKLTVKLEPAEWLSDELDVFENLDLEVANEFELPGSPFLILSGDLPVPLPCDEDATTLPDGQVGVPYSTTLDVELPDGATDPAYGVSDGSELPAGLSLDTDGTLSGTPLASGIHTFSVDVTHSLGFTTAAFEVTIREAAELEILTAFLPGASLDEPYSFTLQANRPADDLVWTVRSGSLPAGLVLDPDGTLAGTPTETGFFSFTARAEHPDSGQTAEKVLALSVSEDIGGAVLGTSAALPAVDVRPDGSVAAILFEDPDSETGRPQKWRLVLAGPDGAADYVSDPVPFACTLDWHCSVFVMSKAAVARMPDGGATVAFVLDDDNLDGLGGGGYVARYGPTGAKMWERNIASIDVFSNVVAMEVEPEDGRIALATNEREVTESTPGVFCGDWGISFLGSVFVELAADGNVLREQRYQTEAACDSGTDGGETKTWLAGLALEPDGTFVAAGSRVSFRESAPDSAFRTDDLGNPVALVGADTVYELASSGDDVFAQFSSGGGPCQLGRLDEATVTAFTGTDCVAPFLTGRVGTADSLIEHGDRPIRLISDAGVVIADRTLPDPRWIIDATVGLGNEVFTVELDYDPDDYPDYSVSRRVLEADLSDPS